MRCLWIVASFIMLLVISAGSTAQAEDTTWQAGTARAKITPEKAIWMSGYAAREEPAQGKLTDLWAKVLALKDPAGKRAVLVTLDLVGIDRETSLAVRQRIEKRYDLDRSQISLCTSHTHTGPVTGDNLQAMYFLSDDQWRKIEAYTANLKRTVIQAVGEALDDLEPCHLAWGSGRATFAVNRRENKPYSKVPELRKAGQLEGPVDHDVPVLAVRTNRDTLKAIVFGYACHATTLSFNKWSGDYPGFAQIALEKRHPEATALFWAGCGGDQNPLPRRTVELAKEYGRRLADAVDRVLRERMKPITGQLTTGYTEVDLPFKELPSQEELQEQTESENRYIARRAKLLLEQIENGRPLSPTYPCPVQVWKLGDEVTWIFLGGEVVVDFARRLKKELTGRSTWVAAYANDVMAYIASKRVLKEGGYEGAGAMVYYGLPSPWALSSEEIVIEAVHKLAE